MRPGRPGAFHEGGPTPIEGSKHGDVEYALARQEWQRRQAGAADG